MDAKEERIELLQQVIDSIPDTLLLFSLADANDTGRESARGPTPLQRRPPGALTECLRGAIARSWQDLAETVAGSATEQRRNFTLASEEEKGDFEIRFLPLAGGSVLGLVRNPLELGKSAGLSFQTQTLESVGRLALGLAHEINTPVQYIGNNIHFLRNAVSDIIDLLDRYQNLASQGVDPKSCEELSQIHAAAKQANIDELVKKVRVALRDSRHGVEQVTEIIRSTRAFAHPGEPEKGPVDLNQAIQKTAVLARNEWKHVARLALHLSLDIPPVAGHAVEIQQVLLTLILNGAQSIAEKAKKTQEPKGQLTIQTCNGKKGWVEISVRDTGLGIPASVQDRIFEPFFTTKSQGKGSGQGLSIAKFIITKRHGGKLSFTSTPAGTTFLIQLPTERQGGDDEENPLR